MTGATPRPPANPEAPEIILPASVQAAAGVAASVPVRIRHRGRMPASMRVTVLGLDSRWIPAPLELGRLEPGEAAAITLTLVPERGALGARYPFVVAVEVTPVRGNASPIMGVAEATLAVDSAERISMSIQPPTPHAVFGKKFRVEITNPGNRDRSFALVPSAAAGASVRLRHDQVQVPAQRTVTVKGKVRIRRPTIMGGENTHTFAVSAQGVGAPEFAEGTVRSQPLIRRGAAVAIGLVLVVALWAGLAIVFIPKISDAFKPKSLVGAPSTVTSQGPVAGTGSSAPASGEGGAGGGSGSGGNGGNGSAGGSGGEGSSGSGDQGGAAGQAGYQLTGTVTGPGAAGVDVTLAPTSLVGASEAGATPAPGTDSDTVNALRSTVTGSLGKIPGQVLQRRRADDGTKSTTTDDKGGFTIAGISAPGYYLLTLARAGFQTQRFLINSTTLASPQPLKVALQPGAGKLSGSVTGADGQPIGAATITITDGTVSLQTSSVSDAATGDPGSWSVDNLSTPGDYLVTATAPGYGGSSTLVTLDPSGTGTADLTLTPGQASIVGTVSGEDELGQMGGLGGITVTATDGETTRTATTVTSQSLRGQYILPAMPSPGEYTLTIGGDGFLTQTRTVTLAAGVGSATVDATLSRADGVVSGTVTGLDATGASQGGLVGVGLTLASSTLTLKTMTTSGDSAGTYRFTGVPPGTYLLTASQFGRVPASATIELKASEDRTVDLTMALDTGSELPATAHIRGQIVDSRTGGPLTCDRTAVEIADKDCVATVTVSTPKDPTDASQGSVTYTATSTSALNFVYTVPSLDDPDGAGLRPGLYTVTVSAPGYETTTTHVQVAQGQTAPAPQVSLPALGIISGTITTRVGTPSEPSCVVAVPEGAAVPRPLPTSCTPNSTGTVCSVPGLGSQQCGVTSEGGTGQAAAGTYQVRGLRHGRYQMVVIAQDAEYRYVVGSPPVVQIELGSDGQFNAILDRLGRVQLTVYDADRQSGALSPADGAALTVTSGAGNTRKAGSTAADGTATITGLNGSYTVAAKLGGTTASADTGPVGLNQTVPVTLVIAAPVGPVVGRVTTNDGQSSTPVPVAGAVVTVSGTIGYSGSTPVSGSVDVTTDAHGCYAIVPATWTAASSTELVTPDCPNPVTGADSIKTMSDVTGDGQPQPATLQSDRIGIAVSAVGKLTQSYPVTSSVITGTETVRVIPSVSVLPQPVSISPLFVTIQGPNGFAPPDPTDLSVQVQNAPGLASGVKFDAGTLRTTPEGFQIELAFSDRNLPAPMGMPGRYRLLVSLPDFVTVRADLLCEMGGSCTFVALGTDNPLTGGLVVKQLPSISGGVTVPSLPPTLGNPDGHPEWTAAVVNEVSGPTTLGNMSLVPSDSDPAAGTFSATVQFDGEPSVLAAAGGKYVFTVSVPGFATRTVTVMCGADFAATPTSDGTQPASTAVTGCTPLRPAGGTLPQLPTFSASLALSSPVGVPTPTIGTAPITIAVTQQPNPSVTITVSEARDAAGNVIVNGDGTVDLDWRDSSLPPNLTGTGTYSLTFASPGFATKTVTFSCGASGTCGPTANPIVLPMLPQITGTISVPTPLPSGIDASQTSVTLLSAPNGVGGATISLDAPVPGATEQTMTVRYTDPRYATVGGPANLASPGTYSFLVALAGYGSKKVSVVCGASWDAVPSADGTQPASAAVNGCTPLSWKLSPLPRFSGTVALHQTLTGDPDTMAGATALITNQPAIKVGVDSNGTMTWNDTAFPPGVVGPGSYQLTVSKPGYRTSAVHTIAVDEDTGLCTVDGGTPAQDCVLGTVTLEMFPAAAGTVQADFLAPGVTDLGLDGASVDVVSGPVGSGQLSVELVDAAGPSATLSWTDPTLPFPGIVRPGSYQLSITVPGYAKRTTVTVDCPDPGTGCGGEIDLQRRPSFSGTIGVLPSTDTPNWSDARFQVTGGPSGAGQVTITAAGGVLSWQESGQPAGLVRPGNYTVSASLTGYISASEQFSCTSTADTDGTGPTCSGNPLTITLGAPTTLKISLESADDATPVTGAQITFQGNNVILAATSSSFTYPQSLDPSGDYSATVQAAGFEFVTVGSSSPDVQCDNGAPTPGLQLAPGATTTCTVKLTRLGSVAAQTNSEIPTQGNPIVNQLGSVDVTAQLLCTAEDTSCPSEPDDDAASFTQTSASNGMLDLTGTITDQGLDAGTWYVTASRTGYQTLHGTVDITADHQMAESTEDDALPIENGRLQLNLTPNKVTLQVHLQDQSSDDFLPAGTVAISNNAQTVVCTIDASGSGTDVSGNTCASSADGYVTFAEIYPGSYDLAVSPTDSTLSQVRLTVQVNTGADADAANNVQSISISLASVASNLSGSVVDTSTDPEVPLVGARVFLSLSATNPTPVSGWNGTPLDTTTDDDGAFTLKGVPDASYYLIVRADGYLEYSQPVSTQASADPNPTVGQLHPTRATVNVDLTLQSAAEPLSGSDVNFSGATVVLIPVSSPGSAPDAGEQTSASVSATSPYVASFTAVPSGTWKAAVTVQHDAQLLTDTAGTARYLVSDEFTVPDDGSGQTGVNFTHTALFDEGGVTLTVSWPDNPCSTTTAPTSQIPIVIKRSDGAASVTMTATINSDSGTSTAGVSVYLPAGDYTWYPDDSSLQSGWSASPTMDTPGEFTIPESSDGSANSVDVTAVPAGSLTPSTAPITVSLTVDGTEGSTVADGADVTATTGTDPDTQTVSGQLADGAATLCATPGEDWTVSLASSEASANPYIDLDDKPADALDAAGTSVSFTGSSLLPSVDQEDVTGLPATSPTTDIRVYQGSEGSDDGDVDAIWKVSAEVPAAGWPADDSPVTLIVDAGEYSMTASPDGTLFGDADLATAEAGDDQPTDISATLPYVAASVTVTVLQTDGSTQVDGATVTLAPIGETSQACSSTQTETSDGTIICTGLEPDTSYGVTARWTDDSGDTPVTYVGYGTVTTGEDGDTTAAVSITLTTGAALITVTSGTDPVKNATVSLYDTGGDQVGTSISTDGSGTAYFTELTAGATYYALATGSGTSTELLTVTTAAGTLATATGVLTKTASLSLTVTAPVGDGGDDEGVPADVTVLAGGDNANIVTLFTGTADPDGTLTVPGLPASTSVTISAEWTDTSGDSDVDYAGSGSASTGGPDSTTPVDAIAMTAQP